MERVIVIPRPQSDADVGALIGAATGSYVSSILTDGMSIAATAWGASLCWRRLPEGGVLVASEPYDDEPGWNDVPDRHLIVARYNGSPDSDAESPVILSEL